MAVTIHVFLEDADRSATAENIAPRADTLIYTSGDNMRISNRWPNLAYAYLITEFAAFKPVTMRLSSASLSNVPFRFERGHALNVLNKESSYDFRDKTIGLPVGEDMTAFGYEEDEAAVAHYLGLALIVTNLPRLPRPESAPTSRIITGALATAAVANAWTTSAITFDDTLPTGKYRIHGGRVMGTGMVAARVIFKDRVERPVIGINNDVDQDFAPWYWWPETYDFDAPENLPTVEELAWNTNTPDIELAISKVG